MATSVETSARCVLLVGNPNTGKSTLFTALSGLHQHVGNYPGVTVEKKTGHFRVKGASYLLVDLPGTYSLAPDSLDELVSIEVLLGRCEGVPHPDVVLCVVDASNLARNLYLVSQLMALKLPLVLALNMNDIAQRQGIHVDAERLSRQLGVPVIPVNAKRKQGLQDLKLALENVPPTVADHEIALDDDVSQAIDQILDSEMARGAPPSRFLLERLMLDDGHLLREAMADELPRHVFQAIEAVRARHQQDGTLAKLDTAARYAWIEKRLEGVIQRTRAKRSWTDQLDRVLLNPWWGLMVSLVAMMALFQAVFTIAEPASVLIDLLTGFLSSGVRAVIPDGALRSLLTDGLIAGVGSVLVFLPQIFLLFFFIALLEDTGYLARVACLMDRLMSRVGLSGKSFLPLLSSFACAIPGIMAARVIENRRDRLITILIAPLMSCSARLPVYTLLISAFIPDQRYAGGLLGLQGLTMLGLYLVGIVAAVVVAALLKKFVLPGDTPSFVMELPTYKWPAPLVVIRKVWDGGWAFVHGAGTLIVAVTILVWAAAYFPHHDDLVDQQLLARRETLTAQLAADPVDPDAVEDELTQVDNRIQGQRLRESFLGRAGQFIEPVVKPLGWDWRLGCAVVASFPAREVVVATLGVLYNLGGEQDEESEGLRQILRASTWDGTDRRVFNVPVALSLMVFFALCAQCVSTLAVMRRETGAWRWPVFTFVYMTLLAYAAALATYQVGMLLT